MMQMTVDPSVFVRAEAAEILGNFLDSDIENQRFLTQRLVQLLGSDGVAVPFGALRGLLRAKRNGAVLVGSEVAGELRNIARNHSIVRVRQVANSLLA